jgi:hypothetical protein
MQNRSKVDSNLSSRIPGWGADLSPENRPGVPKEKKPPQGTGAHWKIPERQKPDVKIHKTVERRELTPVFGATCPPKGLSGLLRNFAYTLPEGNASHWISLLLADRIDVVETIIIDGMTFRAGNPISETGIGVELKERGPFTKRRRLGILAALGIFGFMARKVMINQRSTHQAQRRLRTRKQAA